LAAGDVVSVEALELAIGRRVVGWPFSFPNGEVT